MEKLTDLGVAEGLGFLGDNAETERTGVGDGKLQDPLFVENSASVKERKLSHFCKYRGIGSSLSSGIVMVL